MVKKVGEFVYEDEVLAKDNLQQWNYITSPSTGTIKNIDSKTGIVTIQNDKKPLALYAMCYGSVESVTDNQYVTLNLDAVKIIGRIGFGKITSGRLAILGKSSIENENIVYVSNCITIEELKALADKNINGLICNTVSYSCLKIYLKKDIGVALTGNESLPFSIVLLEGFTENSMCGIKDEFFKHLGKYVLLQPQTQIRAGAIRPLIYIMKHHY